MYDSFNIFFYIMIINTFYTSRKKQNSNYLSKQLIIYLVRFIFIFLFNKYVYNKNKFLFFYFFFSKLYHYRIMLTPKLLFLVKLFLKSLPVESLYILFKHELINIINYKIHFHMY